jgi:CheY-like chemotaxis protein
MDGPEAIEYLKTTTDEIFLILADINMPKMDGLQMKRIIELTPEIKSKAIPFFFHTNSTNPSEVRAAYDQGI